MSRAATIHKKNYNRAYQINRRATLKAAGLCQWCGARPAAPSKRSLTGIGCRCQACAQAAATVSRTNLQRHRPAWKRLGICIVCGCRMAIQGQAYCGVCSEQQQETKAKRRTA